MVDWSKLPEELLGMIAVRLFSVVELKRFRSICRSWRSSASAAADNPFRSRPFIKLNPLVVKIAASQQGNDRIFGPNRRAFLSRAAFFHVSLSSSPDQGWLIKSDADLNSGKLRLLDPLSRLPLKHLCESIDLVGFTVSEIREAYVVHHSRMKKTARGFKRVVLVGDHRVFGIGCDGKIRHWNGEMWTRIKDQMAQFTDIVVHRGLTYALDSHGVVWWISSSLGIFRYGPSLDESITNSCCRDLSLVECCGELYIVDRLLEENVVRKRKADSLDDDITISVVNRPYYDVIHDDTGNTKWEISQRNVLETVGFKVYKMDEELGKWVDVKSLGDNAFVMASDGCFSVLAREFYGCLQHSMYFADKECEIQVFKLDDGSITRTTRTEQSSYEMFLPSFL